MKDEFLTISAKQYIFLNTVKEERPLFVARTEVNTILQHGRYFESDKDWLNNYRDSYIREKSNK